jgi:hypothetical protein
MSAPIRIANASGFYGSNSMREMLTGGPLDVLTGDYLAELTMLILGRDRLRDPSLGYARTFPRQLEGCPGIAFERAVSRSSPMPGSTRLGSPQRCASSPPGLACPPGSRTSRAMT